MFNGYAELPEGKQQIYTQLPFLPLKKLTLEVGQMQQKCHWLVVWNIFVFSIQLGMSSSQLTISYFPEG